jgi:hypothetical protein
MLPLLSGAQWSTRAEKRSWHALAWLAGSKFDAEGGENSQWAFPFFFRSENRNFYSVPYSWNGGGMSTTNRYFACGLAGAVSGDREGWRLFPLYDGGKDAVYERRYAYLDMERLPDEIEIRDAVSTNWTWNAGAKRREVLSLEPVKEGTFFHASDKADICLMLDDDHDITGQLPPKGKEYMITHVHNQGNVLAYRFEGRRSVRFDINTRRKISDVENGESSLFFLLYNASYRMDRTANTLFRSRKVLLKLWDWEEENGDVSLDVFPGFTYDSKRNGGWKASFLWRLFRCEKDSNGAARLHLFFIPLL